MRVRDYEIAVDRRRVEVRRGGRTVATGRWDGRAIRDRSGLLGSDEEIWSALAARIAEDEQAALAAAEVDAVDENGVDLGMIDWMLGLTPSERLDELMRNAAALAPFVRDDLRE